MTAGSPPEGIFRGETRPYGIFVDCHDGSDAAGTGDPDHPFATINRALDARSSDRIILRAGHYRTQMPLQVRGSGIEAAPGETVWLDGTDL